MAAEAVPSSRRRRGEGIVLGGALLLCLATYASGLGGGFLFDDFANILDNPAVRQATLAPSALWEATLSSPSGAGGRPLAFLSFALQMALWGPDPVPFKVFNIALHLVNGLLLWAWLRLLLQTPRCSARLDETAKAWIPPLVTAAWWLAPINLTSVLYVVQRMEALAACFTLFGLVAYTRIRLAMQADRARAWHAAVALAAATLLALGGKETGAILPAYALLVEWLGFGFRTGAVRDRRILVLFACLLVVPAAIGLAVTFPEAWSGRAYAYRPFTLSERLFTEGRILLEYLRDILLPDLRRLSIFHDDYPVSHGWLEPPSTLGAWAALAALGFAAVRARRRHPLFALGVLFFLAGHALVSTYLPLELYHEHRNYLPSAGILLAVWGECWAAAFWRRLPLARAAIVFGALAFYAFTTALRAQEWSDPLRLAATQAARRPASVRAQYHYGLLLAVTARGSADSRFAQALRQFDTARRLPQADLLPLQALVYLSAKHGLSLDPEWWEAMRRYVRSRPLSAADLHALHALNECLRKKTCRMDPRPLGEILRLAHERDPMRLLPALFYAKYSWHVGNDPVLTERLLQQAIARAPRDPRVWLELAEVQIALGQTRRARVSLERAAETDRLGALRSRRLALSALSRPAADHDTAP